MGEMSPNGGVAVRDDVQTTQHEVNFFKPRPGYQTANMKLISLLVVIWAVAVFGFQFLLIAVQKETKEVNLQRYEDVVWVDENSSVEKLSDVQLRHLARATLDVLGKNFTVKEAHKVVLEKAFSVVVANLVPADRKEEFDSLVARSAEPWKAADNASKKVEELKEDKEASAEAKKKAADDAAQLTAAAAKLDADLFPLAIEFIGLGDENWKSQYDQYDTPERKDANWDGLRADLVRHSFRSSYAGTAFDKDFKKDLDEIMELYLTHNQSFLTDSNFMGFPFHYWYTAQFLLILFVLLCLLYAVLIDKVMIKYGRMTKDKKA